MTPYQWVAVFNGIMWTLIAIGGLGYVSYAMYLMIGDLIWAQGELVNKQDAQNRYQLDHAKLDLLKGIAATSSQLVALAIGALFLGAVLEHPPRDPGNIMRAVISPWGVIYVELTVVFMIYIWIRKRQLGTENGLTGNASIVGKGPSSDVAFSQDAEEDLDQDLDQEERKETDDGEPGDKESDAEGSRRSDKDR